MKTETVESEKKTILRKKAKKEKKRKITMKSVLFKNN